MSSSICLSSPTFTEASSRTLDTLLAPSCHSSRKVPNDWCGTKQPMKCSPSSRQYSPQLSSLHTHTHLRHRRTSLNKDWESCYHSAVTRQVHAPPSPLLFKKTFQNFLKLAEKNLQSKIRTMVWFLWRNVATGPSWSSSITKILTVWRLDWIARIEFNWLTALLTPFDCRLGYQPPWSHRMLLSQTHL